MTWWEWTIALVAYACLLFVAGFTTCAILTMGSHADKLRREMMK